MKEILFDILNRIEPYTLIKVVVGNNDFFVCREDFCLPMAIRLIEYDPGMENSNYFYSYDQGQTSEYVKSHKITLHDMDYLIENEITNIKYYDDYFYVVINSVGGSSEFFVSYDSISYLGIYSSYAISASSCLVADYNKIQYELNKGD